MTAAMTRAELLALPSTVDLVTAGRAFGIGRTLSYDLAAAGEFPCRVLKVGSRYRVVTADLLATLGITHDMREGEPGSSPISVPTSTEEEVHCAQGIAPTAA